MIPSKTDDLTLNDVFVPSTVGGSTSTKGPTSHGKKGRVDLKPEPVDLILNNLVIPSAPDG